MKRAVLVPLSLLLCLLLLGAAPIAPTTDYYVNDAAGIVIGEHRDAMLGISENLARATGTQLVLLTVNSIEELGYDDLARFADDVFYGWEVGGREEENGVLIVAVKEPANCAVRIGARFAQELSATQVQTAAQEAVSGMRSGNATKALLNLHSALILRLGEIMEVELPAAQEEGGSARSLTPFVIMALFVIVVGRSYRVSSKYRKRFGKGYVRKARSFARQREDDGLMQAKRDPLYDKIGRRKTKEHDDAPGEEPLGKGEDDLDA